jgi:hypothetical protein
MENDHEDDHHVCAAGAIDFGRNRYWSVGGIEEAFGTNQSAASPHPTNGHRSRLRWERSNRPTGGRSAEQAAQPRALSVAAASEKPADMEEGVSLRQCIAGLAKQSKA